MCGESLLSGTKCFWLNCLTVTADGKKPQESLVKKDVHVQEFW
jgi:hypothetical protein